MARVLEQRYRVTPVDSIRPHPENARRSPLALLRESIDTNGFYGAVVVQRSTGYILVGNHRWQAAKDEGLAKVPAIFAEVDDDEALRILTADNPLGALGAYDDEQLIANLQAIGDLRGTGYTADDLIDLLGGGSRGGLTDPDEAPEPPIMARTTPGDVWLLGPHRVMCGDATSATDLEVLLAGDQAHMVWTDPPYNVAVDGAAGMIANDDLSAAEFTMLLEGAMRSAFNALRPGGAIYVAHGETEQLAFTRSFTSARFKLASTLIWQKSSATLTRSDYQWAHEPVLYGWRPGAAHRWYGGRKKTTVAELEGSPVSIGPDGEVLVRWGDQLLVVSGEKLSVSQLEPTIVEYAKPTSSSLHPTMKPTALIARHIANSSRADDLVLDLFGGSGSTLMAAHGTGRAARLMELDPRFVDVICRRYQEHTGVVPVLESTARPHDFTWEAGDGKARARADADEPSTPPRRDEAVEGQPKRAATAGSRASGAA